ncbi:MAG TPA: hypothetical protein VHW01_23595 [Polyangiaceae bacterium]|nr:hypothetical protein [Polyangiaceae bacterium]
MPQQNNVTSDAARASLATAEAEYKTKITAERDARVQLQVATRALQDDGTAAARKGLIAAEQALRFAEIEARGSSQRLSAAKSALEQAQTKASEAALAKRASAVTASAFASIVTPLAAKLGSARKAVAECEAEISRVVNGFTSEAKEVHGKPKVDYSAVAEAIAARAAGLSAAAILRAAFKVDAPAVMADDLLAAAVDLGVDPNEVLRRLALLGDATEGQARHAKVLSTIGHTPKPPQSDTPSALDRFNGSTAACNEARAKLTAIGFGAAADNVHTDALAMRLLAAPGLAGRVGTLVTRLRAVDFEAIPNTRNMAETAAGRARLAADLVAQLEALGFGDCAAQVRPPRPAHAAVAVQPGATFLNVGGA